MGRERINSKNRAGRFVFLLVAKNKDTGRVLPHLNKKTILFSLADFSTDSRKELKPKKPGKHFFIPSEVY